MGKKQPGLGAVLKIVARGPERSSLFYYLCDHHDEIVRAATGRRIRWEPMAATFSSLGLADCDGKPATAATARKTWGKVRKEVRKQRALRATGMLPVVTPRPKKLPADWRPSGFAQPHAPSPPGNEHQGGLPATLEAEPQQRSAPPATSTGSRPVPGSVAAIREMMNARSGRKPNGDPLF